MMAGLDLDSVACDAVPSHSTLQHSVLLGPLVPMMAGSTGSLWLAFPAVFHLENRSSHIFSQATPVSSFC